ncbi:VOC family protein [Neisseria shayeganii]|uniref:VOC family protein n=1 Tax=Neisseria shayeganii TaxID=607712 RepID=A0A7D7S746_9NEIS|nr:VOC family protein [Neisseria shayeganii]QMT39651.1 VOC family protein [Neisseria shayeganii]
MIKLDPIIAVKDVAASADWYGNVFGFNNVHDGDNYFAILATPENDIVLCLHAWEADGHPTMINRNITAGNGLLLYFRTADWQIIRNNLEKIGWAIEEDIHQNPNSRKQEFSFRDPDGYFITVTEWHVYEG